MNQHQGPVRDASHKTTQTQQGEYSHRLSDQAAQGHHESFRMDENFFRQVVESLEDYAIFITDTQGNISSWNPGAERVLGYLEAEVIGQPAAILFTEQDRKAGIPQQELDTAAREGQALDERVYQRKDGSQFWASGKVVPLRDPQGTTRGFTKIMRNVQLYRTTQAALEESRQREKAFLEAERSKLYHLFRQSPAAICVLDGKEMVFELVNPHFQALYPGRALLGKTVREALPEIAKGPFYAILEQVYQTGEPFEGKEVLFPLARYEGEPLEEVYFNFVYQARLNGQGQVDGILAFGYEVTTQVQARQKLEESEANFRTFANNIQNLAWMAGPDGWIYWYNQRWYDYTGTSLEQMQGWGWEKVHHPDHIERVVAFVKEAWGKGETWELTFPLKGADGTYRWFLTRAYAVKDAKGIVVRWIGTNTDIDDQKRAQVALIQREKEAQALAEELAAANEELQAASEEIQSTNQELGISNVNLTRTNQDLSRVNTDLDNFIYTASHDLKAPIANIEGLMQALLRSLSADSRQSERVQQISSLIIDSVERFKRTIGNLTDIVKLQKEHTEEIVPVDLAQVIEEVLLDLEPVIGASGAQLTVAVADCPPVRFSEKNLRSVVYNLVSNALKYRSPERVPQVLIRCEHTAEYQVFSVQDNGLGMEAGRLDQLFTMFKRFHDHVEGSGIGLYMVKKMVENAGGKIQVESQVGVGTTFNIYFRH